VPARRENRWLVRLSAQADELPAGDETALADEVLGRVGTENLSPTSTTWPFGTCHRRVPHHRAEGTGLAGAFRSYLEVDSAITMGMLCESPCPHYRQVGNAARACAVQMCVGHQRHSLVRVVPMCSCRIGLILHPGFVNTFAAALEF
jgi:hypothetical protein